MKRIEDKTFSNEKITNIQSQLAINIKPLIFKEFAAKEYEVPQLLLAPWLPVAGLALVTAASGVGKTYFCLNCAVAIASGDQFITFKAPKKRKVLYIDGEMKAVYLQERLKLITKQYPTFDENNLLIITPDEMPNFTIPKLCSPHGQAWIDNIVQEYGIDLIIADNISTLTNNNENYSHEWGAIQDWMIRIRSSGCGMLWVHHTGKNELVQRGTQKRIDILDTAILLQKSLSISEVFPVNLKISFQKSRHFFGADSLAFDAYMLKDGSWMTKDTNLSTLEKVVELVKLGGMTQVEIAIELGINKSNVCRAVKKAIELGLLPPK